jgi:phospholipase/carboxylesterase
VGQNRLELDGTRGAILQLPLLASDSLLPLLVLFHGAGGNATSVLRRLGPVAAAAGVAVLAPVSFASTWDAIHSGFGLDVESVNGALQRAFDRVAVDPKRISIGGFSDGATYALSLGLINGDLFSRILAFSPGFLIPGRSHGMPQVFLSHGDADPILPIDRCSRQIMTDLRERGYKVIFREFAGGHEIPEDIAIAGMKWVAG